MPDNILYVDPGLQLGGAEVSLVELMEALDSRLYHPILLCPGRGSLSELCQQKGIQVEYLPGIPVLGGKPMDFARVLLPNMLAISRLIRHLDIRLVHSNFWRVAYYSGLAARRSHIPSVTHVRDYNNSYRSWPKYWLLNGVSDRMITVSCAVQESITSRFPGFDKKIHTIYDGISTSQHFDQHQVSQLRAEFEMVGRFPLIAVVGSFSPLKGQAVIIKALPTIIGRYPRARLLLVGEPLSQAQEPYRDELIALTRQFGIEDQVVFTGLRRDVQLIMASVDVLVHPPTLPDAFPHVLLEASAQKALIVASHIGGIGEIVLDGITGCLVPPGEPEQLASAILHLLTNPELAKQMREAAFARVTQEFTIERHVSRVQSLYAELLH